MTAKKQATNDDAKQPLTTWVKSCITKEPTEFICRSCGQKLWLGETDALKFTRLLLYWSHVHKH